MGRIQKSCLMLVLVVLILGMCLGSARASDQEDIVGRWNFSQNEQQYVRFQADGTFKLVSSVGTFEGNYRVLDGGYIEFDTPGWIYGRKKFEMKYRLNMNTLEFKGANAWEKYPRAK